MMQCNSCKTLKGLEALNVLLNAMDAPRSKAIFGP